MTARADPALGLAELTGLIRDCSISGVERQVLLLRMDRLPPHLTRPHHRRLAGEALEPLTGADRARRYDLPQGRIAISWRGEPGDRLNRVLDGLGHLLFDAATDAPSIPEIVRVFDLPRDGAALLALADLPGPGDAAGRAGPAAAAPAPLPPLDLQALEAIEGKLVAGNVARFARRRAVCRQADGLFIPAWETRYLSVAELSSELCPDRNAMADRWLFRRLTRLFDRRMMALLAAPAELRDAGPFGLELNVASVLSPEFLRFDAALPQRLRGHTVLHLHPADVMGDLPSFHFACAFARARGHRTLLQAATPALLQVLDMGALDLDYVGLEWSPLTAAMDPALLRAGSARWVLACADEEAAIAWGRAAGIGLFQGDAAQPGTVVSGAGHARIRSAA